MTPPLDTPGFSVINKRRIHHLRARVYAAFADPLQLAVWWGPDGFTNDFRTFDLRPGGEWLFTMTNEAGKAFENTKVFHEVVAPERIVFRHIQPVHDFTMTMEFAEVGEATDLMWRMDFAPGQDSEPLAPFLEAANEQNFDRLEAHLNTIKT
ncbi:MAG: SRPBCC domain-containing protein [Asticcacaulis sp.]